MPAAECPAAVEAAAAVGDRAGEAQIQAAAMAVLLAEAAVRPVAVEAWATAASPAVWARMAAKEVATPGAAAVWSAEEEVVEMTAKAEVAA